MTTVVITDRGHAVHWWQRPTWLRVALVLLPIALYSESFGFGLLGLDDRIYYLDNDALHGGAWRGIASLWSSTVLWDYTPICQLTLWLDLAIGGTHSWWFARLHELVWMGIGTLGVHALVLRVGARPGIALAVALLYAVHPVCAQSALWLAERKSLVSLALSLWCVVCYITAVRHGGGWRAGAAAWILGVLALFAKPHAIALPAMLAAYELVLGSGPWLSRALRLVLPSLVVVAFVATSLLYLRDDLHRSYLGGSLGRALLLDGGILCRYLAHTLLPTDLTIYYAIDESRSAGAALGSWAAVLGIAAVTLLPAATRRLVAFAWLFSLAALAPALNLVPQLAAMTDHYHQWALPGLLLIPCLLIDAGLRRLDPAGPRRALIVTLAGAAIYTASLSLARVPEFSSMPLFAAAAVRRQPDSAINWSLLAYARTEGTEPAKRAPAGEAALRAFSCPDADRIFDGERLAILIEAAVLLHQRGLDREADELCQREYARLPGGGTGEDAALAHAQISMRTGYPQQAVQTLAPFFSQVQIQAASELRRLCRDGMRLPDMIPALLEWSGAPASRADHAVHKQQYIRLRLQCCLAVAYLESGQAEKAFDVAALLVNLHPDDRPARLALAAIYRALGLADAASRLAAASAP
jgi:tetratricopeptide (TPR) repeat protein